jgi:hypothetical protein
MSQTDTDKQIIVAFYMHSERKEISGIRNAPDTRVRKQKGTEIESRAANDEDEDSGKKRGQR